MHAGEDPRGICRDLVTQGGLQRRGVFFVDAGDLLMMGDDSGLNGSRPSRNNEDCGAAAEASPWKAFRPRMFTTIL